MRNADYRRLTQMSQEVPYYYIINLPCYVPQATGSRVPRGYKTVHAFGEDLTLDLANNFDRNGTRKIRGSGK